MNISVIIPAHNEERSLNVLLEKINTYLKLNNNLDVVVVCNACSDNSVTICRQYPNVRTYESDVPSKINALNIGDREAKYFPRFYLDADILISVEDLFNTAKNMLDKKALACSAIMNVDFNGRPKLIKQFYRVWLNTPYCKNGMVGSGLYGLSLKGRQRFNDFPDIIADDGYIRLLFNEEERYINPQATFTIQAPWNLKELIKIKTRAHLGDLQLKALFPELQKNQNINNRNFIKAKLKKNDNILPLIVYSIIRIIAQIRARKQFREKKFRVWERDLSNR